jgi:outer membrane protein TolC
MIQKSIGLALCIGLTGTALFAQTTSYSLEEVWQKTLLQYPSLSARKAMVERQQLNQTFVRQQALPKLSLQAQQNYGSYQTVPGAFFPLPGQFNTAGSGKSDMAGSGSSLFASATVQWELLQFGRIRKKHAVAETGTKMSEADLSREAFQLQTIVTRYYFEALHQSSLLHLYQSEADRLKELWDLSKAQADAGLKPGADTLLIQSAYLQAKSNSSRQQALLQAPLVQLAALMGEAAQSISIDTAVYFRYRLSGIKADENVENHPYLQYLQSAITYTNAELDVIKKEVYPSVGLLAGMAVKGSAMDATGTVNKSVMAPWQNGAGNYLVGIGLSWNLSSLYENKTKRLMKEREIAAAKNNYGAARVQLQALYAAAVEGWKQQSQSVTEAHHGFESVQKAYALYAVRYETGLINLIELLQLQKQLQDADRHYVQAVSGYWNEIIQQSEALGNPSLLLSAIKP